MSDTSDKRGKPAGGAFRAKGPRRDFKGGEREGSSGGRPHGGKPRFDRDREGGERSGGGGRPHGGKPRFDRNREGGAGERREGGKRPFSGKPSSDRDREGGERPSGGGGRPFGDKPRFGRDREAGERPSGGGGRPFGGKPRFGRDREGGERSGGGGGRPFGGKPRFGRDREGGERSGGGGGRPFGGKPRFGRDREGGERSGSGGGRPFGGKPRFDRDREGGAREGREGGKRPFSGKPRFDRDRDRGKSFDRGGDRGERRDHKPYEKKPRLDADRPRRGREGAPPQDRTPADRGHSDDRLVRVSGLPSVAELFRSAPERVERLFFTKDMHPDVNAFCSKLAEQRKVYREVEPDELRKVAGTAMHGGVVALAEPKPVHELDEEAAAAWAEAGETIIVLDGVGNPQNIGAIARTTSFLGIKRLLVSDHPAQAGLSNAAYRIAKGGLEGVDVYRVTDLPATLRRLKSHFHVVGTALGQGVALEALPMAPKPVAIVFGNEEEGLGEATLAACHSVVSIPGGGTVQSLNVSAAAAILIYGLQRRSKPKG